MKILLNKILASKSGKEDEAYSKIMENHCVVLH